MFEQQDNSPYIKKMIGDITPKDSRVQVVGRCTGKLSDTEIKISDGSGEIIIIFGGSEPILDRIRENMILKVLGEMIGDSGDLISVKYAADYSDVNFELYKKVHELRKGYFD